MSNSRILTCVGGPCAGMKFSVTVGTPAIRLAEQMPGSPLLPDPNPCTPRVCITHIYHVDRIAAGLGKWAEFLRWEGLSASGVGAELLRSYRAA